MKTERLVVALIIFSVVLGVLVYGVSIRYIPIPTVASVKAVGVGVYWDKGLTQVVSSINWGIIEPGGEVNRTVYIQNTGNVPITIGLWVQNWKPANASTYITLNWNYAGQLINVNETIPVTLTLVVKPDITGIINFSFDIIISSMG